MSRVRLTWLGELVVGLVLITAAIFALAFASWALSALLGVTDVPSG